MAADTTTDGGPRTGRGRRTTGLRALAGVFYLGVAVQLIGGFLVPSGQHTFTTASLPGVVALAGMVTAVCVVALLAYVRPWATRPDEALAPEVLEARRTAQLRAFGLVAVAALTLLVAATLAAGFGDFTAGSEAFTPWTLGLAMLSVGGPSAALAWLTDQG